MFDEDAEPHGELPDLTPVVEEIETAARRLGLHLEHAGLVPDQLDPHRLVLVANFSIGALAFSDRVQRPEQDAVDGEFRKIELQTQASDFEALRAEMERRAREGKGIFDAGEDATGVDPEGQ